jgi:RNA polymerase sigma factor (sigma-70 family)
MRKPWLLPDSHEDAFLDRYDQLMRAALHLTGHDRARAEDLLHTVFVQFTLSRPDLSAIRNLDDYLFVSLRNTQISHARRQATVEANELFVADYDSAEIRLKEASPAARLLIEDQLWTVCNWACERKQTAKDSSILILRFFHGYYPREIAKLASTSTGAVDKAMQTAREAVRIHMAQPAVANNLVGCAHSRDSRDDFLTGAQAYIFGSREGPCLPEDILRTIYKPGSAPLSCGVLAHLVSCRICLDRAGKILGIGSLADRHPHDTLGPQGPTATGPGRAERDRRKAKERFKRKSLQLRILTVEHRPKTLFASVNGLVLCSHTTQGPSNKFTLRLPTEERVGFVEVHSEQGIHLLLLNLQSPPDGELKQEATAWLGDETPARALTARMDFTGVSPLLEVLYRDPNPEAQPDPPALRSAFVNSRRPARWRVFDWARLRPRRTILTSTVAIATIAALLWTQTANLSAAVLLQRSAQSERSLTSQPGRAVHRVVTLEERTLPSGRVTARRRIDVWTGRQAALRIYDERGTLVSGEWTSNDGRRLFYRKGMKPTVAATDPDATTIGSLSIDEVASLPPSAIAFQRLLADSISDATVSRQDGAFYIHFARRDSSNSALRNASLVLDGRSLAVTEETLVIARSGATSDDRRQLRFVESQREIQDVASLPPAIFTPEPELIPPSADSSVGVSPIVQASTATRVSEPAIRGTVFAVIRALDRVQALLGEQIDIRRTPEGALRIEGFVADERRRQVILAALRPEADDPSVELALKTFGDAVGPSGLPRRVVQREFAVTERVTAADVELERYFARQGVDSAALSQEIERFRVDLQNRSREGRQHARALQQIVKWLPENELSPRQTDRWKEMIRSHAAICRLSAAEIDRLAAPVFGVTPAISQARTGGDLESVVRGLAERAVEIDQSLLSALSLRADGRPNRTLRDPAFWRSLKELEDAAREIEERTHN